MHNTAQPVLAPIALKPELLQSAFEVQTRWHVITGAPSCGKTTLINQLAEAGYPTVPEGARLYMESQLAQGRTIADIRADICELQCAIKDVHADIERGLPANACLFLDRALPDCLAWHRAFGLDPNTFLRQCFRYRYASVWMLDPLPLNLNGLRFKDPELQAFLHEWHIRDYTALGYSIHHVPALPPEARLAFILEALSETGALETPERP